MQELLPILLGFAGAIIAGAKQRRVALQLRMAGVVAVGVLASLANHEQQAWPIALFVDTALVAAGAAGASLVLRILRRTHAGSEGGSTTQVAL